MTATSRDAAPSTWDEDIRVREEATRKAFLETDLETLDALWDERYVVNSPLQRVLTKPEVLELLRAGRIRHREYDVQIEHISRQDDVVVVMGSDTVLEPPAGVRSRRRYTNVWRWDGTGWRTVARHAHVVSTEQVG